MERIVRLHIEKLPEGVYLDTSDPDAVALPEAGNSLGHPLAVAAE